MMSPERQSLCAGGPEPRKHLDEEPIQDRWAEVVGTWMACVDKSLGVAALVGVLALAGCASGPVGPPDGAMDQDCVAFEIGLCPQAENRTAGIHLVAGADANVLPPGGSITFHFGASNQGNGTASILYCSHLDSLVIRGSDGREHDVPRPWEGSICTMYSFPPGESLSWNVTWDGSFAQGGGSEVRAPAGDYDVVDTLATEGGISVTLHVTVQ